MCGKELKPRTLIGQMMRLVLTHHLNPAQAPLTAQDPAQLPDNNPAVMQSVIKEEWDLCEDCQRWIFEEAQKHKEELNKTKDNEQR